MAYKGQVSKGVMPLRKDFDKLISVSKKKRMAERLVSQQQRAEYARTYYKMFRLKALNDKQKFAIHLLTDFSTNLSITQICKKVGVQPKVFLAWRRDPFFLKCLDEEITRLKTMPRLDAYRHLFRWVRQGNYKAVIDYLTLIGDLSTNMKIQKEDKNLEDVPEEMIDAEIKKLTEELEISIEEIDVKSGTDL